MPPLPPEGLSVTSEVWVGIYRRSRRARRGSADRCAGRVGAACQFGELDTPVGVGGQRRGAGGSAAQRDVRANDCVSERVQHSDDQGATHPRRDQAVYHHRSPNRGIGAPRDSGGRLDLVGRGRRAGGARGRTGRADKLGGGGDGVGRAVDRGGVGRVAIPAAGSRARQAAQRKTLQSRLIRLGKRSCLRAGPDSPTKTCATPVYPVKVATAISATSTAATSTSMIVSPASASRHAATRARSGARQGAGGIARHRLKSHRRKSSIC